MFRLIFIFLITALGTQAQQINFEQAAFNYFASEIFTKNYHDAKRIYYCGQTENERSITGPFAKCFETDSNFSQFYYQQKKSESEKLTIESNTFHQFKKIAKSKSGQLNLRIYRAVTNGEMIYVYIKVFKEKHFVDHYLVKMSSNKVVDVCHSNEII
jgi:hypothetical protein